MPDHIKRYAAVEPEQQISKTNPWVLVGGVNAVSFVALVVVYFVWWRPSQTTIVPTPIPAIVQPATLPADESVPTGSTGRTGASIPPAARSEAAPAPRAPGPSPVWLRFT